MISVASGKCMPVALFRLLLDIGTCCWLVMQIGTFLDLAAKSPTVFQEHSQSLRNHTHWVSTVQQAAGQGDLGEAFPF